MAQRRTEREKKKVEPPKEPDIKKIIKEIEDSIGKASQTPQKEIEEYKIAAAAAIVKKLRSATEREHVPEKAYRKAHEDAKDLAALLTKGAKYLNRWG